MLLRVGLLAVLLEAGLELLRELLSEAVRELLSEVLWELQLGVISRRLL